MSRRYLEAAKVLRSVLKREASLKTLALGDTVQNKRFVVALVTETLRHKKSLDQVLSESGLRKTLKAQVKDDCLLYLLIYDSLVGKGIQGGGQVKRLLQAHDAALRSTAKKLGLQRSADTAIKDTGGGGETPDGTRHPRYARVNTLKCTLREAVEGLTVGEAAVLKKDEVKMDEHVKGLLVMPAGIDLHDHPLVESGKIVLQDKASCFSALALLEDEGPHATGDVLDACAAPGNKTSQLAALLAETQRHSAHTQEPARPLIETPQRGENGGRGKKRKLPAQPSPPPASTFTPDGSTNNKRRKVIALDRDVKRLEILKRRVLGTMGASAVVEAHLQDFLALEVEDPRVTKVRGILLDPSCSGSGMVHSVERKYEDTRPRKSRTAGVKQKGAHGSGDNKNTRDGGGVHGGNDVKQSKSRLLALSQFQYTALIKAFSFHQVERVVYSTCSVHIQENEQVVRAALDAEARKSSADPSYRPFILAPALKWWPRRGLTRTAEGQETGLTEEQAECLVRTDPHHDGTIGFFVALFTRRPASSPSGKTGSNVAAGAGGGGGGGEAASSESTKKNKKVKGLEGDGETLLALQRGGEGCDGGASGCGGGGGGGGGKRKRQHEGASQRACGGSKRRSGKITVPVDDNGGGSCSADDSAHGDAMGSGTKCSGDRSSGVRGHGPPDVGSTGRGISPAVEVCHSVNSSVKNGIVVLAVAENGERDAKRSVSQKRRARRQKCLRTSVSSDGVSDVQEE